MTHYEIIPATEEHAYAMADHLRPADVKELWAAFRLQPLQSLLNCLQVSHEPKVGLADGELVCIYGVGQVSELSQIGYPWLRTTALVQEHKAAFLRRTMVYVANMRKRHTLLYNVIDARNTDAFRWMKWLGFEFAPARPFGPDQLPFHAATMEGM